MDKGSQLVLLALLLVPVPLVILVALLRGYTIHLHLQRERHHDD